MSAMNSSKYTNNGVKGTGTLCEGVSPGRCPPVQQRGPGRHHATAKIKWNKELNTTVMECYYLSNPVDENDRPIRGYRQRMHRHWRDKGMFEIKEQNLCDQARAIRKNEWLSAVELEMIKRRVNNVTESELNLENEPNLEDQVIISNENNDDTTIHRVTNEEEFDLVVEHSNERTEEEKQEIREILSIYKGNEILSFPGLKRIDRKTLSTTTKRINQLIGDIRTVDITQTNRVIYATMVYSARKVGLKPVCDNKKANQEPWWKRRILTSINDLRKHINILERKKAGTIIKKTKFDLLNIKYRITAKGLNVVIEELKQRLKAKSYKIKRYESRIEQFRINRMFNQDQKKVYEKLQGKQREENVIPDAEESKIFWSNIWSKEVEHQKDAEWLDVLRTEKKNVKQMDLIIDEENVKKQLKKVPNWKSPGPDGVQGYWIKNLNTLHSRIANQLNDLIRNRRDVPEWMTKGRTVLCQKDPAKGSDVGNFRPISCLPLMWKLMTAIISEEMYSYLDNNGLLANEQKGCRKKSRGTKDQLIIDKCIMKDCKRRHKNLSMAWVDYKKAYDMVPHSWIIECMKLVNIAENITQFIERTMPNWKTVLTASGKTLCEVDIKRGIFQGDSLSPLIFILCAIPLSTMLRKMKPGYTLGKVKVNNLLFMDDLKLFGKNENEIESLLSTVHDISVDIRMEFGIQKCGVLVMKRGKIVKSQGIKLRDGEVVKEIEECGYKYLGVLEVDMIMENEMKTQLKKEYCRRIRLVMKSKLCGRNKITAINTWAVPVIRYGAGIIKWTKDELIKLDRKTRKTFTIHKGLNPNSDVDRLYVKRKDGGRGLIGVENTVRNEENNFAWYIKNNEEELMIEVKNSGFVNTEEAYDGKGKKQELENQRKQLWKEKRLHGQVIRENEHIDWESSWQWLKKGDLKAPTEALICSAQEQSLRTNYIRHHIDKTSESPLCRMCNEKGETVSHIVSECKSLAQREYKRRHDNVARYVHWILCEKANIDRTADAWYDHKPDGVLENDEFKILWDINIQCDRIIEARRPDIIFIDKKEKFCKIIDIAIPGDSRVNEKEREKMEKYQLLKDELVRLWDLKKVNVIPVVIGALGLVSSKCKRHLEKLEKNIEMNIIQKTALLGTARILRKVLSL